MSGSSLVGTEPAAQNLEDLDLDARTLLTAALNGTLTAGALRNGAARIAACAARLDGLAHAWGAP